MMSNLKFKFLSAMFFTALCNSSGITAARSDKLNLHDLSVSLVEQLPDGSVQHRIKQGPNGLLRIMQKTDGTQVQCYSDRVEFYLSNDEKRIYPM
jgi:hypothetical protein